MKPPIPDRDPTDQELNEHQELCEKINALLQGRTTWVCMGVLTELAGLVLAGLPKQHRNAMRKHYFGGQLNVSLRRWISMIENGAIRAAPSSQEPKPDPILS